MTISNQKAEPELISKGQLVEVMVIVVGTALVVSGINGLIPSLIAALVIWAALLLVIVSTNWVRRSRWRKANQPNT